MESKAPEIWRQKIRQGFIRFFIFDGFPKIGLPGALAAQIFYYFYDFGCTTAHLSEFVTGIRVFFFFLSAVMTGLLVTIYLRFEDEK